MIRCYPFIVATGIAAMGVTITLHGGGTEIIRPYGWQPRPPIARPAVRRVARPAAVTWALRCYDTGYRGGGYGPGYGGPWTGPYGLPLGAFGGGFGSYGGGHGHTRDHGGAGGPADVLPVGAGLPVAGERPGDRPGLPGRVGPGLVADVAGPDALPQDVPEPGSLALAVLGVCAAMVVRRRRE